MMKNDLILSAERYTFAPRGDSSSGTLIFLCFLAGCLMGAYFVDDDLIMALPGFLTTDLPGPGMAILPERIPHLLWFHFLAFLMGMSLWGFLILPPLAALRGFALFCSSATIISSVPESRIFISLLCFALPTLFLNLSFLIACLLATESSLKLAALWRHRSFSVETNVPVLRITMLVTLFIGVLVDIFLIPRFLFYFG